MMLMVSPAFVLATPFFFGCLVMKGKIIPGVLVLRHIFLMSYSAFCDDIAYLCN
jgi:hypothetical protein